LGSRHSALILAALITAAPLISQASNMRFLEFSPSAFFTEEDWAMVRGAARDLLDNHADGESIAWKNDANGHNGKLTVLNTYSEFGTTCRRLKVFSDAIEVSATRVVNMCKNKKGEWKILN
jgi:surface antigen